MIRVNCRSLRVPVLTYEQMTKGAIRQATVNFVSAGSLLSTSVSSVTWTVRDGSNLVSISNEALNTGVATATITANSDVTGCAVVQVKATMANGQTVTEHIQIEVVEVGC